VEQTPEIIIIKRKALHGGHHGGAWKVAYADFVTAMMSLFIVLWMMNASKQVQEAVGGYFKDPRGSAKVVGTNKNGAGDFLSLKKEDMQKLKQELMQAIHRMDPDNKLKDRIEITVTQEGLRIELMESAKGTFFELGDTQPTPALKDLLQVLSQLMQAEGVRNDQVSQVRGFADQRLRLPQQPEDPSNRRISLIVQYLDNSGALDASSDAITRLGALNPNAQDPNTQVPGTQTSSPQTQKK
jgi:chemotaxis protein MotB